MGQDRFLIDGKYYSPEECKDLFVNQQLGEREKVCLDLVTEHFHDIVDLGCLYGIFAKALKERFPQKNIIAGDYDDENLRIARFINQDIKDIFKKLNVYRLEIEDQQIDCVLLQEVIEHLEDAARAIKEINRILKNGGELIISTPTPYQWRDMWQNFKYEFGRHFLKTNKPLSDQIYYTEHEWNRHIYSWTPSTLYTLLKINGFEYVTHTYCKSGKNLFERFVLKHLPFLSPVMIIKVKKTKEAPSRII